MFNVRGVRTETCACVCGVLSRVGVSVSELGRQEDNARSKTTQDTGPRRSGESGKQRRHLGAGRTALIRAGGRTLKADWNLID